MRLRHEGVGLWTADLAFPSWRRFRYRPPGWRGGGGAADDGDVVRVVVRSPPGDAEPSSPGAAALARLRWFLDHEAAVSDAARGAVVAAWPGLLDTHGEPDDHPLPVVASATDLESLLRLRAVVVHAVERDGVPYLGFEMDCVLDDEHGLGVMMQGARPVELGGADTAILGWIAERDARARR